MGDYNTPCQRDHLLPSALGSTICQFSAWNIVMIQSWLTKQNQPSHVRMSHTKEIIFIWILTLCHWMTFLSAIWSNPTVALTLKLWLQKCSKARHLVRGMCDSSKMLPARSPLTRLQLGHLGNTQQMYNTWLC